MFVKSEQTHPLLASDRTQRVSWGTPGSGVKVAWHNQGQTTFTPTPVKPTSPAEGEVPALGRMALSTVTWPQGHTGLSKPINSTSKMVPQES